MQLKVWSKDKHFLVIGSGSVSANCWKDENKEKEAGNSQLKQFLVILGFF